MRRRRPRWQSSRDPTRPIGNAQNVRERDGQIHGGVNAKETERRIEVALEVSHAPFAAEAPSPPPRAFVRERRCSYTQPAFELFEKWKRTRDFKVNSQCLIFKIKISFF